MSFEDDFVLPPRSTGRPPNRKDATTSRSASASSSVENRSASSRNGGERSRRPPAAGSSRLLTRVLSVAEYADELRRGGCEKLSESERIRRFGSKIVPIPVPLDPNESEATHEKRFRGWLAKRRIDLEEQTRASECKLRTDFAKFKVRVYNNAHGVTSGGKRGRAQYERVEEEPDDGDDDDDMEQDDYYDEEDRSYRAVYAEEDEESVDRYDEEDEADDDEDEDLLPQKRQRTEASQPSADVLLRKRVLTLDQYRSELEREKVRKMTSAERMEAFGTNIVPVPVPLLPGETVDDYEEAFLLYLLRNGINSARFASNPNAERSQRVKFALHRATTLETVLEKPEKASILARVGALSSEPPIVIKSEPSYEPPVVIKSEPITEPTKRSSERTPHSATTTHTTDQKQARATSNQTTDQKPTRATCSLVRPAEGSSSTAQLRAFLACGCHSCLVQCVVRLVDRVDAEEQVAETKIKVSKTKSVMDITRDGDPSHQSAIKGVDVAKMVQLTSLMKSRRQRQSTNSSSKLLDSSGREDPIELQLMGQYDEINARVGESQRALEGIAGQVQATPIDLVDATAALQRQMQDLEGVIEDEMDHRNAALAMLAVYLWRHDKDDLAQRVQGAGAGNIPHVQRVCHQKCATIATELANKRAQAAALKLELDAVLMGDGDGEDDRLATLQRVGDQLTRVEQATATLQSARRREVATLIHFDAHVRELVETLMQET